MNEIPTPYQLRARFCGVLDFTCPWCAQICRAVRVTRKTFKVRCTGKDCRISTNGAGPLGEETVTVQHPTAGKWKIVVDAPSAPSGNTSYDYLDVVFNQAYGMVSVTDMPARHESAGEWSPKTNVWAASLPAGREAFAALLMQGEATRTQVFPIGLVQLPRDRPATGGN